MEFPNLLREQIEFLFQGTVNLAEDVRNLSQRYRGARLNSDSLLKTDREALAYALVRMPATFGAVSFALSAIANVTNCELQTMLDVGAGTGACGWAAEKIFDLKQLICLEREVVMRKLGQRLMQGSGVTSLVEAQWLPFDLVKDDISQTADLVTASYVLNELDAKMRELAVKKLWQATKRILLIVEPGMPEAFKFLLNLRQILINEGAYVLAPCPHASKCPLPAEDWCHFSARVARSRLHRQLKGADMGYEDEKYCFLAVSRQAPCLLYRRILKEPKVSKARVLCEVCSPDGALEQKEVSLRDKASYRVAKKWCWGDILT